MEKILATACLFSGGIVLLLYFIYRARRKILEKKREYLELQKVLMEEHYAVLKEKMELTRQYREEIGTYMDRLKEIFGDEVNIGGFQQEILQELTEPDSSEYCENPVLNSIFKHKREECEACRIQLDLQISGLDGCRFRDMDMVGILYNLFDNAIEACCLIPDADRRKISVSCNRVRDKVIFIFENTRNPDKTLKGGIKTWKKNKSDHGIGMEVLYGLVQRNHGKLMREERKDIYRVRVVLPAVMD